MKLMLAVAALVLASAVPGSGCGWTGLILAPPQVQVRGQSVLLETPLRVVQVEKDSPADRAGMTAGMELLSLDQERWDEGGFLGNLVRLQALQSGDRLRIVARDAEDVEHTYRLEAELCSESQAHRRARSLANLGSIAGMMDGRLEALRLLDEARYPEAREMYRRVLGEHEAARQVALERLNDPVIRLRIKDAMRTAEEVLRQAQDSLQSEEWRRDLEDSLSQVREVVEGAASRRQLVESLQQTQASRESVRRALESAHEVLAGDAWRRPLEESLLHAQEALQHIRMGEMEMGLVREQMRRALAEVASGGEVRRLALLQASGATQRIRRAGALLRGASFQQVEPGIARHVGVHRGLLVLSLEEDSALADAGLEVGDVLLSVEGRQVDDGSDLFEILGDLLEAFEDDAGAASSVELEIHQPTGRRTIRLPLTLKGGSKVL